MLCCVVYGCVVCACMMSSSPSRSCCVIGPGFAFAMFVFSIFLTGRTYQDEFVRKTSSAFCISCGVIIFCFVGMFMSFAIWSIVCLMMPGSTGAGSASFASCPCA